MLWIVLPVRNESTIIARSIHTLRVFLDREIHEPWILIVVDNASTDATREIVSAIATADSRVELLALDRPGKGLAIRAGWEHALAMSLRGILDEAIPSTQTTGSPRPRGLGLAMTNNATGAAFLFMDVDLATDLRHLPALIAAVRGGADVAIGSRSVPGAQVERSALRRFVSWANRILLRALFGLPVADAPCGFKAVNERVIHDILPLVRDDRWFFDTELLIHAHRAGFRIAELPVRWRESRDSRGSLRKVIRIARENLRAIQELRKGTEFRRLR